MRTILALVVAVACAVPAEAGPVRQFIQSLRGRGDASPVPSAQPAAVFPSAVPAPLPDAGIPRPMPERPADASGSSDGAGDALAEVNAARARRGLRPFTYDPGLTTAAMSCARDRASRLIAGHLRNDFAALPPGSFARATGCAAWPPYMGWGSCCTYENYTYAGAAYSIGRDGKRYMHIFVR